MKKRAILTLLLLVANMVTLFAQPSVPCDPDDPATCPLDTWVVGFAAAALIFTVLHLNSKAKSAPQLPNN